MPAFVQQHFDHQTVELCGCTKRRLNLDRQPVKLDIWIFGLEVDDDIDRQAPVITILAIRPGTGANG
ncbi:hypothetical protein [Martelella sp. HB161492]|uniref:hypothetical protein n=1 Tax=Martelella sp. HB161492 TaxID=2720726 RepID=UPI0015926936|nr:hypothetical protein [Martelella sp. HB161492]